MQEITSDFIKNVMLVDKSEYASGRTRFWSYIQNFMSSQLFASIEFDKKPPNALAFFQRQRYEMDRIYMPEGSAELQLTGEGPATTGTIRFVDDYNFALFLHEASHYLHMIKDAMTFTAPSLQKLSGTKIMNEVGMFSKSYVVDLEYEAGYRSLTYARQYSLFAPDDRTVEELNLSNMLNYIMILNKHDFDGCNPKVYKRRIEEWKHTTSFKDIADYMTVI